MEKHDEKIRVESKEGVDSIFFFTVPFPTEPVKETFDQLPESPCRYDDCRKLKILILEDYEVS